MKNIIFTLLVMVLTFSSFFAQEVKNNSEENPKSGSIKIPNETQAANDKVEFKNESGNSILTITDEGNNKGSITLPVMSAAPSNTSNKLYNEGGTLKFNGSSIGSGSGAGEINDLSDAKYDGSSLFLGTGAGANDDGPDNKNTAVGYEVLSSNTSGYSNTANGYQALFSNTTGAENTAVGHKALYSNSTGTYNTAVGYSALTSNTVSYNTAIGYYSLYSNTTGAGNTAIGSEALRDNTTGRDNIAIGEVSLLNNTTGKRNTALGNSALSNNQSGENNTAIGYNAGSKALGDGNIFLGYYAGFNETGSNKLYIESGFDDINNPLIWGDFSLDSVKINGFAHVTKAFSAGSGAESLALNSVAFGKNTSVLGITSFAAGEDNAVFSYNSSTFGLGLRSSSYLSTVIGRFNDNDLLFDNENWIANEPLFIIGNGTDDANRANAFTVKKNGNTNINGNLDVNGKAALGFNVNASGNNSFAIGSNVIASGDGTIFLGDNSSATVQNASNDNRFAARFANGYRFYTNSALTSGVLMNTGDNAWSSVSDSTKKENFIKVDGESVLNKISKFNLRSWNYKGQDPAKFRHYGPMAQEFYAAFGNDGIGTIGNDTTIASADFDGINLIAIQALEKRTKEQKVRIAELETRIEKLENQNQNLAKLNSEYRKENSELREDMMQIKQILSTMQVQNKNYKIAFSK